MRFLRISCYLSGKYDVEKDKIERIRISNVFNTLVLCNAYVDIGQADKFGNFIITSYSLN